MSAFALRVLEWCPPCVRDADFDLRLRAAFADGPVADHPEPVTAERRIVGAEPHRTDLDAMLHDRQTTPRNA